MLFWRQKTVGYIFAILLMAGVGLFIFQKHTQSVTPPKEPAAVGKGAIISGSFDRTKFKSDNEWKNLLSEEQYYILRQEGTERPYSGDLLDEKRKGTYYSVGCGDPLFSSETKFESGTGWPSFYEPIDEQHIVLREDTSLPGAPRVEILDRCGNHLGHVFDDGPQPTGKRFCMNSDALRFEAESE